MQCPRKYCFHWVEQGDMHMPFVFSDVKNAIKVANKARPASKGHCGCPFGICTRESKDSSYKDWYEPNELELEKDGLPIKAISESKRTPEADK